jgi:hypothetical protein
MGETKVKKVKDDVVCFRLLDGNKRLWMTCLCIEPIEKELKRLAAAQPEDRFVIMHYGVKGRSSQNWQKVAGFSLWHILPQNT